MSGDPLVILVAGAVLVVVCALMRKLLVAAVIAVAVGWFLWHTDMLAQLPTQLPTLL